MKSTLGIGKKSEKSHFKKCKNILDPKILAHIKIESKISDLGTKINILHRQMTEKMSLEVGVKKWSKIGKVHFLKCTFLLQMHFATKKKIVHMKIKNKISYLGKRISILHR